MTLTPPGSMGNRYVPHLFPPVPMEKPNFEDAVRSIVAEDKTYEADGYHFLRDALDHTVSELRKDELEEADYLAELERILTALARLYQRAEEGGNPEP